MISLIVAMDQNQVIGLNNDMPWHLPNDLAHFKATTTGHTIIMGRKTFESIGKPLPNRNNVVLTRQSDEFSDDVLVIHSLDTVYKWNKKKPNEEFFIIGGGNIYKQALPYTDRMYITQINQAFDGDTYFPKFTKDEWTLTSKTKGKKDKNNHYDYYFLQYDRIK